MKKFNIGKLAAAAALAFTVTSCSDNLNDVSNSNSFNAITPQVAVSQLAWAEGAYIVVLKDDATMSGKDKVKGRALSLLKKGGADAAALGHVYSVALKGFSVKLNNKQLEKLQADESVAYIERDLPVSLAKPGSGGGGSAAQETPWGITRVKGGANYNGSGVAWVIDTGIDLDHPDLNVDASRGFSAFDRGRDAGMDDGNGHGTHCAGTIAAINNSIGVVGVAAGATVIPVKVLDSRGSGQWSGVIAGIEHVGANAQAGDVVNMSLGGGASQAIDDAVVNAAAASGAMFCLAAGNESDDANNHSPARANGNNIYTISAMDVNGNFASFSNYGNPPVDYCLPGVAIKSTWLSGGYNTISGTSMATPHAAGILLATGGAIRTDGTVKNDPDGNADQILVVQ